MDWQEEQRLLRNWRGRRLLACRATDVLQRVIDSLGVEDGSQLPPNGRSPTEPSPEIKTELRNTAANLQRLILIFNDGHVSKSTLNAF